jgi:hypothetical protein
MATTYTASIASGYMTDVVYANIGPSLVMMGHFVAPDNATALVDTGMFGVRLASMEGGDIDSTTSSANANGTITCIFSGHGAGDSGMIMVWGF